MMITGAILFMAEAEKTVGKTLRCGKVKSQAYTSRVKGFVMIFSLTQKLTMPK